MMKWRAGREEQSTDPDSGAKAGGPRPGGYRSMRVKGIAAVVALTAYLLGVGYLIMLEREKMPQAVDELDGIHQQEERLIQLNMSLARAIFTVNENYHAADVTSATQSVLLDVEPVQAGLQALEAVFPVLHNDSAVLGRIIAELARSPNRGAMADLRSTLHSLVSDLDIVTASVRDKRRAVLEQYRNSYDAVTIQMLIVGLIGILITGGAMTAFFTRLAWDIRKVQARTLDVAKGLRGKPMPVTRHDELGALMEAVNDIQRQLRQREIQIELARQQAFHQEKMAAIGTLAAAVAHELNNPLSAIMGVARSMVKESEARGCADNNGCSGCQPQLLLDQAGRVTQITRQLSEFSVPRSPEARLLDLNGLVRATCTFITYDQRFRGIDLKVDLDSQLPAVTGVADHITQVLMNLLFNSADAMEGIEAGERAITVSTRQTEGMVVLSVSDTGTGMDESVLNHVFDEYFTTKPSGKGTGLGLAVCKSLVESGGGRITVQSRRGSGTIVTVSLPFDTTHTA